MPQNGIPYSFINKKWIAKSAKTNSYKKMWITMGKEIKGNLRCL